MNFDPCVSLTRIMELTFEFMFIHGIGFQMPKYSLHNEWESLSPRLNIWYRNSVKTSLEKRGTFLFYPCKKMRRARTKHNIQITLFFHRHFDGVVELVNNSIHYVEINIS